MTMYELLFRELREAEEAYRSIVQIRVSTDGIPGAPATTPLTPERARQFGLMAVPANDGVAVVADPHAQHLLEVVVHPKDWADLLKEPGTLHALELLGPVRRVFGIPVRT